MIVNPVCTLGVFCAAVECGHRLVDAELADGAGILGDQRLHGALPQRLDLVGACVESDDLDLPALARLLDAGGRALGREQVDREDADQIGVALQLRADQLRGGGGVVVAVLDADVVELRSRP